MKISVARDLTLADGQTSMAPSIEPHQQTLKRAVSCCGVGLHTGRTVNLTIKPAAAHSGIRFLRSDLPGQPVIPARVEQVEARVGGRFRMAFTNFGTGHSHSFGGEYLELVQDERVRYVDRFDDPNLPGEMRTTIQLKKVMTGTEVSIGQAGIPAVIPTEMCYLGWQESLQLLALLVEPEIPGE